MTDNKAIFAILAGIAAIVVGLTMKQFYAAGLYGTGRLGRPIARWKGRLLFLVIGFAFLAVGIAYFCTNH